MASTTYSLLRIVRGRCGGPCEAGLAQAANLRRHVAFGRTLHKRTGGDVLGTSALHRAGELGPPLGSLELPEKDETFVEGW
jgi:hypothetical protein